jgi:hypothetical protein
MGLLLYIFHIVFPNPLSYAPGVSLSPEGERTHNKGGKDLYGVFHLPVRFEVSLKNG